MLDPAASRRITANLAVVYPSLTCGRVEPSIVPVRQTWQIPSAVYLLECGQISRFRLCWSCLGASIEAFGAIAYRRRSFGRIGTGKHNGRSAILDSTPSPCPSPAGYDRRCEECRQTAPLTRGKVKKDTERNQKQKFGHECLISGDLYLWMWIKSASPDAGFCPRNPQRRWV